MKERNRVQSMWCLAGVAILATSTMTAGCQGGEAAGNQDLGVARIAFMAPRGVGNVELRVQGGRLVTMCVPVDGQTTTRLDGLPTGQVTIGGAAYAGACGNGDPLWLAEPVTVTLRAGEPTDLTIVFRKNGIATITASFVDDEGSPACAQRTPISSPPASSQHGMTYFKPRKETLLATIDGSSMVLYAFATSSRQWFHVDVDASKPIPPARNNPVFELDEATGKAVLFGGESSGPLADLWEFDGCGWLNRTPATLPSTWPSPRWAAASAFDPATRRVIITTGIEIARSTWDWASGVADATVYEWQSDSGTFRVRPPTGAPPAPRGGAVAVGDPSRNVVLLASGLLAGNQGDSHMYRWDGASGAWAVSAPSPALTDRMFAGMYRDAVADRVVVTGGQFTGWLWKPDYYQYNPATDAFSVVGPDATYNRFWAPIAYDSDQNVAVQFGGYLADSEYYGPTGPVAAPSETRIIASGGVVTTLGLR